MLYSTPTKSPRKRERRAPDKAALRIVPHRRNKLHLLSLLPLPRRLAHHQLLVILAGMNYIVISNKDMIPGQTLSQLRQIVQGVIAESASDSAECEMIVGTAATLWCSLAMTCGPQGKNFINDLNTVLALLPPVIDDDDMPFTAQFLCHALQQWPDAVRPHMKRILVNIFASGEWCLKLAPRDAMSTLASLIQQIPEPELLELVKWNQHHLLQITKNIKRYQTQ